MRVFFARHGETEQIAAGISQGQGLGGDLNLLGKRQAHQLAVRLQREPIDHIYCSDLRRAVDTAAEIGIFHPRVPVYYTSALRERSLGVYEGRPKREWKEAVKKAAEPFHLFKPVGGESYMEVQERIYAFYQRLVSRHPSQTVLLVAHGGPLTILYLTLLNYPIIPELYEMYRPMNSAITIGEVYPGEVTKFEIINSTKHLHVLAHSS